MAMASPQTRWTAAMVRALPMVEPDLFVVSLVDGKRPRAWEDVRALLLAVEVLSPSTMRRDRVSKRQLYQRQGVAEHWIVDVDTRMVERWRAKEEVGTIFTDRLAWQPDPGVAPLTIDLGALFRDVTGED